MPQETAFHRPLRSPFPHGRAPPGCVAPNCRTFYWLGFSRWLTSVNKLLPFRSTVISRSSFFSHFFFPPETFKFFFKHFPHSRQMFTGEFRRICFFPIVILVRKQIFTHHTTDASSHPATQNSWNTSLTKKWPPFYPPQTKTGPDISMKWKREMKRKIELHCHFSDSMAASKSGSQLIGHRLLHQIGHFECTTPEQGQARSSVSIIVNHLQINKIRSQFLI